VGTITDSNGGGGPADITADTTNVTFTMEALTADVTVAGTLAGADDTGEIVDYAAYRYQEIMYHGETVRFYRLDAGLDYTLGYTINTSHGAAVCFKNTGVLAGALGTGGVSPPSGGDPIELQNLQLNVGAAQTLADVEGVLPITFTTPGTPTGWAGLRLRVPVSALSNDLTATHGDQWYIQGGLANNRLEPADGGTSGGGILFAIGNPLNLTTTIRGTLKSDYDPTIPGSWSLKLYNQGGGNFVQTVSVNPDGSFIIQGIDPDSAGYQLKVEGTVAKHVTPLPQSAVFKMVAGQQKTVDLELVKEWQKSDSVTGLNWPRDIASDGTFFYVRDNGEANNRKIRIANPADRTLMVSALSGNGIALDGAGNVFMTENQKLFRIGINENNINGAGLPPFVTGLPTGGWSITMADGYLYATTNTSIVKVDPVSGLSETIVGGFVGASGIGAYDNFLYVTDYNRHTLWRVDPVAKQKVLLAGADGTAQNTDGIGEAARFSSPRVLVPDGDGNLYIIQEGGSIRKVNIAARKVTTLSMTGTSAAFSWLWGACMIGRDLYVVSSAAGTIIKLTRDY
jgi:sugar lactone lactonase YvrE